MFLKRDFSRLAEIPRTVQYILCGICNMKNFRTFVESQNVYLYLNPTDVDLICHMNFRKLKSKIPSFIESSRIGIFKTKLRIFEFKLKNKLQNHSNRCYCQWTQKNFYFVQLYFQFLWSVYFVDQQIFRKWVFCSNSTSRFCFPHDYLVPVVFEPLFGISSIITFIFNFF